MRIIQRQRDGLVKEHPFTKPLFEEAKQRLAELVEQEKKKDQEKKREIQNEETTKSLRKLGKEASKFIANKMQEFEIENTGEKGLHHMQAELLIVPRACIIKPSEDKTFSVFAKGELVQKAGNKVTLRKKEGNGFEFLGKKEMVLRPRPNQPEILSGTFKIRGTNAGEMALVQATLGDVSADAVIQVEEREKPISVPVGLSFERNPYHVRMGKTKKLTIRAKIPGEDLEGVMVKVRTDSEAIVPLRRLVLLSWNRTLSCFTADVEISGKQLGARGKVTAHCRDLDAETRVAVVQSDLQGLFSFEPKIVDEDFGPQRAVWDRANGILKISARHESVGRYLGPTEEDFAGQDKPHFKTLLAEIVADQVARHLLEIREEKRGKEEDFDTPALYLSHQKIMGEFLPIAHKIQLPSAELKKLR